jgi:hypothetical protein
LSVTGTPPVTADASVPGADGAPEEADEASGLEHAAPNTARTGTRTIHLQAFTRSSVHR